MFFMIFFSQSSNLLNQARLKVLKARDEHVGNVLNDGKRQLGNTTRDQQKYSKILEGLIAQVINHLIISNRFAHVRTRVTLKISNGILIQRWRHSHECIFNEISY